MTSPRQAAHQFSADTGIAPVKWLEQGAALAWLGQLALSESNLDVLFAETVGLVARAQNVHLIQILESLPDQKLQLRAGWGAKSEAVGETTIRKGPGTQEEFCLRAPSAVIIEDFRGETRFPGRPDLGVDGVRSGICVPIENGIEENRYGLLCVYSRRPKAFSADDVHFLSAVSAFLAAAVRQSRADEDREARTLAEARLTRVLAESRQQIVVMEAANRVALDILSSRTGTEALKHIAEAARMLGDARYAALGVAYPDKPGLESFITSGLTPDQEAAIGDAPKGKGILGLLLERNKPLRISHIADHQRSAGFPPNHPVMDSFLGVPIRRGDTVVGSLYLANKQNGKEFTEADEIAVSALGAHAAVAIHNLRMLSRQRDLTRSLITAQEEERRAVAHDLHDGLTQYVMAAQAHLEAYKRARAAGNAERAARRVDQGMTYLNEAVLESRRMINNLRLLVLDDLGLTGALEQLVREESARAGWTPSHLEHNIGDERYEPMLETAIYRVAQEALNNARKHSGTKQVQISLSKVVIARGPILKLRVRDWGIGFQVRANMGAKDRFGLQGMLERVHLLNGTCELHSEPGQGTELTATFPI